MFQNEIFSVNVTVSNVTDLVGYNFELYYDSAILNCTGVELPPGHFLETANDTNLITARRLYDNTFNRTHGYVWVAIALMKDEPGRNGSGTLATVEFKAIAQGDSILNLYDTMLVNRSANAMPHIVVDGSVTVPFELKVETRLLGGSEITDVKVWIDDDPTSYLSPVTFNVTAGDHTVEVESMFIRTEFPDFYLYTFVEWEDGSTDNPRTVPVYENRTITAYYKKEYAGSIFKPVLNNISPAQTSE